MQYTGYRYTFHICSINAFNICAVQVYESPRMIADKKCFPLFHYNSHNMTIMLYRHIRCELKQIRRFFSSNFPNSCCVAPIYKNNTIYFHGKLSSGNRSAGVHEYFVKKAFFLSYAFGKGISYYFI